MDPEKTVTVLTGMKDMMATKRNPERVAALDDAIACTRIWIPEK